MAKSLKERWESRKPVSAVLLVGAIIGAVVVSIDAGVRLWDGIYDGLWWRHQDYVRLHRLHAGFHERRFRRELGVPAFDRRVGDFRELTFQGRGYWVQAIADGDGVVQLYAVTVCEAKFRPTFEVPGGGSIRLGTSSLARASSTLNQQPITDYILLTNTANRWALDYYYGGNPGYYKTFIFGWVDACDHYWESSSWKAFEQADVPSGAHYRYRRNLYEHRVPAWLRSLRSKVQINTYAETAPAEFETFGKLRKQADNRQTGVQIGPDRILVRTTYGAPPPPKPEGRDPAGG